MPLYGNIAQELIFNQINIVTLELSNNFDSFYNNDLTILNESFIDKIKEIWEKIKVFFTKIKSLIKSILLNLNKLKSAKLPKKQCDDLEKVLKVMQPRTLQGTKELTKFYNEIISQNKDISKEEIKDGDLKRNQGPDEYSMNTSFEFEIDKTLVDIKESLNAMEKLEEYKRLEENSYEKKDIQTIPLNYIMDDFKECMDNSESFEKDLNKISSAVNKIDESNSKLKRINEKMIKFCKENIRYYNLRIKILNKFIKSARFSIKAVKSLFGDKINFTKTSTNINGGKIETITLGNEEAMRLPDLIGELQEANTNKDYKTYKKLHSDLMKVFKISDQETITILNSTPKNNDPEDDWDIKFQHFKNTYDEIPVGGRPLYHHSSEDVELTELKPTAVGNWGQTYYPDPRVYVHMNVILNKAGKKLDQKYEFDVPKNVKINLDGTTEIEYEKQAKYLFENRNVYKIDQEIDTVYKDTEMGGTGTFIISEKPIKLKKIEYEEWKKENDFD